MFPEIPDCLRRDRNNVAPFMRMTERLKADLTEQAFEDALVAFRTQNPDAPLVISLDGQMSVGGQEVVGVTLSPLSGIGPEKTVLLNPSDSLQATSQDWVPPWGSKS